VVGYSRLVEQDEAATLAALRALRREALDPPLAKHKGRIVKLMGDGAIVEFASAVDAVACAVAVQKAVAEHQAGVPDDRRIVFRIGVNLGDVVVEGDGDLLGDGVNVAARLEALAEPGGVCVSANVREEVRGKLAASFEDLGEQAVKNISRPIRAYRVRAGTAEDGGAPARALPSLPDKPSIAVLPFQNMGGDPEQDYFADGVVEDIITELARLRWLFVIARHSSFAYKGRNVDVRQVGRELGVRYVLEGSVRKAGGRVRITGQLVDASTGAHLWADRFDGELADVFDLQDRVTASVIGAITPKLERAEIERAKGKPTGSLDAYDHFLRGMAAFYRLTRPANAEALALFAEAIELDPEYAAAYAMAARCYLQRKWFGWVADRTLEIGETRRLARRAIDLGWDDAVALGNAGLALIVVAGDLHDGAALLDRALALNQNLAWAWNFGALAKTFQGEPEVAIERAARAMRLSPQDAQMFAMQTATAWGHFFLGRDDEALSWAEAALRQQPNFFVATCIAAAAAALAGRTAEAARAMTRLREIDPALRLGNLHELLPFRRPEDFARWAEGLRRAGLPE
jgi:adenylate cyclase